MHDHLALAAALIWIAPASEQELRVLFKQVIAARKKGAKTDVQAAISADGAHH